MRLYVGTLIRGCAYTWVRLYVGAPIRACAYTWVRLYVGTPIRGCAYTWVRLYVGAPIRGCAYTWVLIQVVTYVRIPQSRIPIYGIRSPNPLHEIKCRTNNYMNSFFPNCVKSWYNIGDQLRNSVTLSKFKIVSLIRPPKKAAFGIHDPNRIKLIFRLRFRLSQLKYHKRRYNFLDTPTDLCDCRCGPDYSWSKYLVRQPGCLLVWPSQNSRWWQ